VKTDPLAGLTRRQRQLYERRCAAFLVVRYGVFVRGRNWPRPFDAVIRHQDADSIIAERYDLNHPLRAGKAACGDCVDCGANLQASIAIPPGVTLLCVCCATQRAHECDPRYPEI